MRLNLDHLLKACLLGVVTVCAVNMAYAEGSGRIVKWKDEKGVTHYGDTIPPQYANRENSVMSRQGTTVKRNKSSSYQDPAADLAKLEQEKKDKALLGAFTHADEIDLARDRNVQLDLISLENLQQEKQSHQKKLLANQALADDFVKRKKPVPADVGAGLVQNKAEMVKIDERISARKQAIEATRQRFDEDKQRYLALRNQTPNDALNMNPPSSVPTEKPLSVHNGINTGKIPPPSGAATNLR